MSILSNLPTRGSTSSLSSPLLAAVPILKTDVHCYLFNKRSDRIKTRFITLTVYILLEFHMGFLFMHMRKNNLVE